MKNVYLILRNLVTIFILLPDHNSFSSIDNFDDVYIAENEDNCSILDIYKYFDYARKYFNYINSVLYNNKNSAVYYDNVLFNNTFSDKLFDLNKYLDVYFLFEEILNYIIYIKALNRDKCYMKKYKEFIPRIDKSIKIFYNHNDCIKESLSLYCWDKKNKTIEEKNINIKNVVGIFTILCKYFNKEIQ